MPMYSDKTNAENILHLSEENRKSFVFGAENVVSALCRAARETTLTLLSKRGTAHRLTDLQKLSEKDLKKPGRR